MSSNNNVEAAKELTAASALAGLAKEQKDETSNANTEINEEEDFHIPQRYTKSGRKRAVPFTIKVGERAASAEMTLSMKERTAVETIESC